MAIKQYNKQFVYVKVEKAPGKTETLVMSMHAPYFMARISKFTHTEEGNARLDYFLQNNDPKYYAKLPGYRVYALIVQSVDSFDELSGAAGNILQSEAVDIAEFYLNDHLSDYRRNLYVD